MEQEPQLITDGMIEKVRHLGHLLFDRHVTQEPIGSPFYHPQKLGKDFGYTDMGEVVELDEPRGA